MGHRYFLHQNHPYRRDARSFDGTIEEGKAPSQMFESKMLRELDGLVLNLRKMIRLVVRRRSINQR